jgi:sialate O-acetylesterase
MKPPYSPLAVIIALSALGPALQAEVKLSKAFGSHMVLQRDMPVPVWGTADANEAVTVSFQGQTLSTRANSDGKWRVTLAPLKVGGPESMKVGSLTLEDVLVGEVWVGSGQSNMDMPSFSYTANDPALAKLVDQSYPHLRMLRKGANDRWEESNPTTNAQFSAQLFAFGQALQAKLKVPVGLMVGAVGGTPSGFWLTKDMVQADPACLEEIKKESATYDYEGLTKKYEEAKVKWTAEMELWKKAAEDAKKAEQKPPNAPRAPQPVGRAGEVNSGAMGQLFENYIRPYVGYAIRGVLWDQGESKTNVACLGQYTLMGALIKGWRKEWGQDFAFLYVQKPSGGGTAWDPTDPFFAQASKFAPQPAAIPPNPPADYSHELFLKIREYPNTYMVTSTDIGPSIHPVLKSSYGQRGAHVALGAVYGAKHEIYGPLYAKHKVEGGKVRIEYTHTGKGLEVRHSSTLQGFLVAGEDRVFRWAEAAVDGQNVLVSSPEVPKPVAVRYAWGTNFPWANLFNRDGLPAQPFRTDSW